MKKKRKKCEIFEKNSKKKTKVCDGWWVGVKVGV